MYAYRFGLTGDMTHANLGDMAACVYKITTMSSLQLFIVEIEDTFLSNDAKRRSNY